MPPVMSFIQQKTSKSNNSPGLCHRCVQYKSHQKRLYHILYFDIICFFTLKNVHEHELDLTFRRQLLSVARIFRISVSHVLAFVNFKNEIGRIECLALLLFHFPLLCFY